MSEERTRGGLPITLAAKHHLSPLVWLATGLIASGCSVPVQSAAPVETAGARLLFSCTSSNGALSVHDAGGGRVLVSSPRPIAALRSLAWRPLPSRYAQVTFSGGGETQLQIATDTGTLLFFERTVRTNFDSGRPNDPAFSAGVILVTKNRTSFRRTCRGDSGFKADPRLSRREAAAIRHSNP